MISRDLPDGPVVRNPPSNAGDAVSIPGQETKIPLATKQLSLPTTTRKSVGCNESSCMMNEDHMQFSIIFFKL